MSHVDSMRAAVLLRYANPLEREKSAKAAHLIPAYKNNTSGYKGVSFRKDRGVWRATIKVNGKNMSLGVFDCAEKAARAYDAAAIAAWGDCCYLNFPNQQVA